MQRGLALIILIYALVLSGLALLEPALLVLALPLILYFALGLMEIPRTMPAFQISRSLSTERAASGTLVRVRVEITNEEGRIGAALVEDEVPEGLEVVAGTTSRLTSLAPDETIALEYIVRGERGYYTFRDVRVTLADRHWLFPASHSFPAEGSLFVLPKASRLNRVAIRPLRTLMHAGAIPAPSGGIGVEFYGLREYQYGDSLRQINWKATARQRDRVFSNEFEQERGANVGLILDARQRSDIETPEGSLFEHAVTVTAALAQALLQDGNRVGLLIYGGYLDWTYPGFGKYQRERILRALMKASPRESQVFDRLERLPTRVFPAHSQLIFISSLNRDDIPMLAQLRGRAYEVMVVSPDPVSFEAAALPPGLNRELAERFARLERAALIRRLGRAGVQVLNWDVHTQADTALHKALRSLPPRLRALRL